MHVILKIGKMHTLWKNPVSHPYTHITEFGYAIVRSNQFWTEQLHDGAINDQPSKKVFPHISKKYM